MIGNFINMNFWWIIRVFAGITLIVLLLGLIKRKQIYIFIFGLLIVLAAFPTGFASDLAVNGCCGASNTGNQEAGFIIGIAMAVVGILIMAFSKKLSRK
jgi:hypothetical protein